MSSKESHIILRKLLSQSGVLFMDTIPDDDWMEGVAEKIYRTVQVKVDWNKLKSYLTQEDLLILSEADKTAIAIYLGFNSWDECFKAKEVVNDNTISKSFYYLVGGLVILTIVVHLSVKMLTE